MVEAADEAGVTIAHLTRAQTTRRVSEACHKGDAARAYSTGLYSDP
jgi:hypothetical protein